MWANKRRFVRFSTFLRINLGWLFPPFDWNLKQIENVFHHLSDTKILTHLINISQNAQDFHKYSKQKIIATNSTIFNLTVKKKVFFPSIKKTNGTYYTSAWVAHGHLLKQKITNSQTHFTLHHVLLKLASWRIHFESMFFMLFFLSLNLCMCSGMHTQDTVHTLVTSLSWLPLMITCVHMYLFFSLIPQHGDYFQHCQ